MDVLATYRQKDAHRLPALDERVRRLVVASDAQELGYGGLALAPQASGLERKTMAQGIRDLAEGILLPANRVRQRGGGRQQITERDHPVRSELRAGVAESARGDPASPLPWTNKRTRTWARALTPKRPGLSHVTVASVRAAEGAGLPAKQKARDGTRPPDREAQFASLSARPKEALAAGEPVIALDTQKKALGGHFKNPGQRWLPKGQPLEGNLPDCPAPALGNAGPDAIAEVGPARGDVHVGSTPDTAAVAGASLRRWWEQVGKARARRARRLLITAAAGGSNGYRLRRWKKERPAWADDPKLALTVGPLPPGTSKWTKLEPRLFSCIRINGNGRPLTS